MQNIKTHEENFIHTLESSKRKDREAFSCNGQTKIQNYMTN